MKKFSGVTMLSVLTAYMIQSILNVVNPILANIANSFPDLPFTSIILISSLPPLVAIPANLISGKLALKIGYKAALLSSLLVLILTGLVPAFIPTNFTIIIISRVVFGIAYGIGFPLCAMMVIAYFDSSQHSKMMGYGSMFVNAGGILFSALAGVLATVAWRYSFYVHLILGVPFILGLFLKKPPERDAVLSGNVDAPPKNEKMNIAAWLYAIGLGVTMLFIYPFFAYASAVIEEKGLGGSVEASYFIITTAITGIVVGLIFAKSYKLMRRRLYPVSSAIIIVGLCVLVASKSLAALLAAAVLVSFGFYHIMTGVFVGIGEDVPGKAVAAATGITVAFMNAFSFIGPYILTFLSGLIGRSDSNVTPFYFAIGYFVIVGAATLFIRKKEAY